MGFETRKGLTFFSFKNFETKYRNLFPSLLAFFPCSFSFGAYKKNLILQLLFLMA